MKLILRRLFRVKKGIELQLDWTDDFKDPRTGLRLKSTYDLKTSEDSDSPEYYLTSHGLYFLSACFRGKYLGFPFLPLGREGTKRGLHRFENSTFGRRVK